MEEEFSHSWSVVLPKFLGKKKIVSARVKTLSNTNLIAARYIYREKDSIPADVYRSKTSLLKLLTNVEWIVFEHA